MHWNAARIVGTLQLYSSTEQITGGLGKVTACTARFVGNHTKQGWKHTKQTCTVDMSKQQSTCVRCGETENEDGAILGTRECLAQTCYRCSIAITPLAPATSDDDPMSRLKRTAALIQAYTNPAAQAGSGAHDNPASVARRARTRRRLDSADPIVIPEVCTASLCIVHAAQAYAPTSNMCRASAAMGTDFATESVRARLRDFSQQSDV